MGRNREALERLTELDWMRVAAVRLTSSQAPAEALKAALGSQEVHWWLFSLRGTSTCHQHMQLINLLPGLHTNTCRL